MYLKKNDFIFLVFILLIITSIEFFKFRNYYGFDYFPEPEEAELFYDSNILLFLQNAAELNNIPGIGKTYSKKISEYSKENKTSNFFELKNISGIGPKKIQTIMEYYEKNR